jgi:hypothetical protein
VELIATLERAAARSRGYSKALLSGCGICLAALYWVFAILALLPSAPTMHQSRFLGLLSQHKLVAAEAAGVAMALLSVLACVFYPRGAWRSMLGISTLLAALQSVFWAVALFRLSRAKDISSVRNSADGFIVVPPVVHLLLTLLACQQPPPASRIALVCSLPCSSCCGCRPHLRYS